MGVAELDVLKAEEDVLKVQTTTSPRDSCNHLGGMSKPGDLCQASLKPAMNGSQQSLSLFHAFRTFSDQHTQKMDARHFAKMCKEASIFDKAFTPVDADLVIKKVLAGTGQRRIDFPK